jgi:hypothetical protein
MKSLHVTGSAAFAAMQAPPRLDERVRRTKAPGRVDARSIEVDARVSRC